MCVNVCVEKMFVPSFCKAAILFCSWNELQESMQHTCYTPKHSHQKTPAAMQKDPPHVFMCHVIYHLDATKQRESLVGPQSRAVCRSEVTETTVQNFLWQQSSCFGAGKETASCWTLDEDEKKSQNDKMQQHKGTTKISDKCYNFLKQKTNLQACGQHLHTDAHDWGKKT